LGNSPREFTRERVAGRESSSTTTKGTAAALQSCIRSKARFPAALRIVSARFARHIQKRASPTPFHYLRRNLRGGPLTRTHWPRARCAICFGPNSTRRNVSDSAHMARQNLSSMRKMTSLARFNGIHAMPAGLLANPELRDRCGFLFAPRRRPGIWTAETARGWRNLGSAPQ